MDVQTRIGMPMDEFIRQYDQQPFELINGEKIERMPPVALHAYIIKRLMALLTVYEQTTQAGQTFSEAPFVLADVSDWVKGSRVPDVLFYSSERWATYIANTLEWRDKPFILVPDLCIEVISKNDIYEELDEKVAVYLEDGVRLVWVINPRNQTIKVYRAGSNQITQLTASDLLTGDDVLSGFSTPISAIFPQE